MYKELKKRKHNKGFTLLEILLVVAIVAILGGVGVPIYQSFQTRNDLDIAANNIVQNIRRAQILSRAVDGDTSWGLYLGASNIVLFKGSSYASRDTTYDENTSINGAISHTGISEVVFTKFTGAPNTTGDINLSSSTNESRVININTKGTISF